MLLVKLFASVVNISQHKPVKFKMSFMYVKVKNSSFEYHIVDSNCHHLHLVGSANIAGLMSIFIERCLSTKKCAMCLNKLFSIFL